MGGCWLFVFASCLLVQSLSAEGSVKANSTSAVKDNSTSAVKANSTSAVKANSTSEVKANSTSTVKANSTSAVKANSTSAVKANSTSAVKANSTSAVKANSTSAVKANSTSAVKANSTSAVKANSTSAVKANSTSAVKANSTSVVKANSTSGVKDNSTSAVTANSTSAVNSDEELEKKIGQQIASLQKIGQDDIRSFADFALKHYNAQEASVYTTLNDTPLKNATVTVKKAVGTMVCLRMTLEKTNCTRKDVNPRSHFRISRLPNAEKEELPKYCGPLAGQDKEQLDCKFDIFKNERSFDETVVSHECNPVKVIDKSIFDDIKS